MTVPQELATASELSQLIDDTIKRLTGDWRLPHLPIALEFPKELETVYEAETRHARVRELHFTVTAAVGFMWISTFTDLALIPDMVWTGIELHLLASAVLAVAIYLFSRVSGRMREIILFVAGFLVVSVIDGKPCLSRVPTAPFQMFFGFLAIMYANTTVPFRFQYAWPFSILCLAMSAAYMHFAPTVNNSLVGALMYMGLLGVSFTLIANYRMERSARLGYLLASKEALRLFALNRERDELATISNTDALTGIANRGQFDRRLATLFAGSAGHRKEIHLIMLDVDFFKRYNDRYGHPAGDACLRSIADVLTRVVRGKNDFAFRYGGEEFGALLLDTSRAQVEKIAERIRGSVQDAAIEHGNREDGLQVVTVSLGAANAVVGDGSTPESLLDRADRSLYASKKAGRNRITLSTGI